MPLDVACPACYSRFRVPKQAVGKKAKCAHCGQRFVISGGREVEDVPAIEPLVSLGAESGLAELPLLDLPQPPVSLRGLDGDRNSTNFSADAASIGDDQPTQVAMVRPHYGNTSVMGFGCWMAIAIPFMCGGFLWFGVLRPSHGDRALSADDLKVHAWVEATRYVRAALTSPGTADFGSPFGEFQDPERCVKRFDDDFLVLGWVDAQNSFGATVRTGFSLRLRYDHLGKTWELVDGPRLIPHE